MFLAGDVHAAIKAGDAAEVASLLRKGANPNREGAGGLMGGTPLTWAVDYKSKPEIIRVLIKGGANVNQRTSQGYTALMGAQTPEIAQLLLNAGADPTLRDNYDHAAWNRAYDRQRPQVAEILKRAETDWFLKRHRSSQPKS
jgi:ankyrin repeat protein